MDTETRAGSLEEVLQEVKKIRAQWLRNGPQEEIWFRGHARCDYRLLPGLYRPDVVMRNYDEVTIFERFKAVAAPLVRKQPASDWEWYFLAQHHGLRTRLLDWTESLLAAMYFALCEEMSRRTQNDLAAELSRPPSPPVFDDGSPAIWIMDAGTLNAETCGADKDYIFVLGGKRTDPYLPEALFDPRRSSDPEQVDNRYPLAILAPRSNERIVAQQGLFTVHGRDRAPLDELGANCLRIARIVLDRANIGRMWRDLETCGVNPLSLFPDLDHAAQHVLWTCQNVEPAGA